MLYPTEEYLTKLRQTIEQHRDVPFAQEMIAIINVATDKKMTTQELNIALMRTFNSKEKLWARVKHRFSAASKNRAEERADALKNALNPIMRDTLILLKKPDSPKGLPEDPQTPDSFTRTLFMRQYEHDDLDAAHALKVNNAIMRIKRDYNIHYKASLQCAQHSPEKIYHERRLKIIWGWMTPDNFSTLVDLIKATNNSLKESEFNLEHSSDESKDTSVYKQHALSWLGIIFEELVASEVPGAMSEIRRLNWLDDWVDKEEFFAEVKLFSDIYIQDKAPALINIGSALKNEFLKELDLKNIAETKKSMMKIYQVMYEFVFHTSEINESMRSLSTDFHSEHPSNRSSRDISSSSDSSSLRVLLNTPHSRRESRIISATSTPDLAPAKLVESNEPSKTKLIQ